MRKGLDPEGSRSRRAAIDGCRVTKSSEAVLGFWAVLDFLTVSLDVFPSPLVLVCRLFLCTGARFSVDRGWCRGEKRRSGWAEAVSVCFLSVQLEPVASKSRREDALNVAERHVR